MCDLKVGDLVVLDESTKPYKFKSRVNGKIKEKFNIPLDGVVYVIEEVNDMNVTIEGNGYSDVILKEHLLLAKPKKEMESYKIKVTPETTEEVQNLFFELGYIWHLKGRKISYKEKPYLFAESDGYIMYDYNTNFFNSTKTQEITLPQLRDLAVLKRNDVNDATHEYIESGNKYYRGFKDYVFDGVEWILTDITSPNSLKPINREMAWQDALRAVADGKEGQCWDNLTKSWYTLNHHSTWSVYELSQEKLRLKPKTIHVESGDYTKDEINSLLEKFND